MGKVWFITGASRGFGRIWTETALRRGDCVIAAAREPEKLADLCELFDDRLLPVTLDVCDRAAAVRAVEKGVHKFGRVDVVINNAGYALFCPLEDVPESDARKIIETNFLGSLWVIQAVLPLLREQKKGHIIQISSIAGLMTFPGMAMYNATKWAVEGLLETLAGEVDEFSIHVTLVEPGPHLTDWIGCSATRPPHSDIYPTLEEMQQRWPRLMPAAPESVAQPMMELVDAAKPPLRILLGEGLKELILKNGQHRLAEFI
ncbi:SDR family oxidoreductase [Pectobacterium actinidiae]|uniref:SDR family oxidoreductase n=1 Tax=Pectobacterium actinidiae TaxID=1507808 RepID=UPI0037F7C758